MRVAIAGAGNVGRSIAAELVENGHEVLLIDKDPHEIKSETLTEAEWLLADACELSSLEEAGLDTCDVAIAATGDDKVNLVTSLLAKTEFGVPRTVGRVNHPNNEWLFTEAWGVDVNVSTPRIMSALVEEARLDQCDVVIAATGDDKANLVTSLLAKTEFGVPRTVGRVNHPNNEWLFTEAWGVDVNVSTPRIMSALVEEAVTIGDVVRLFTFRQGNANLVELTLPDDSPFVGKPAGLIPFPENCALVTILRDGQVYTPDAEQPIEAGDELLFVVGAEGETALEKLLSPSLHGGDER